MVGVGKGTRRGREGGAQRVVVVGWVRPLHRPWGMEACLAHASADSFGSGKAFTGRSDWRVRLLASSGLARRLLGTDCGLPVCGVSARGSLRRVGPRAVHLVRRLNLLPPGLVLLLRWPWCPRPWPPSALRRLGVGGVVLGGGGAGMWGGRPLRFQNATYPRPLKGGRVPRWAGRWRRRWW